MTLHAELKAKAVATYNAAADSCDASDNTSISSRRTRARVKRHDLRYLADEGITAIEANVIYAIARKPGA